MDGNNYITPNDVPIMLIEKWVRNHGPRALLEAMLKKEFPILSGVQMAVRDFFSSTKMQGGRRVSRLARVLGVDEINSDWK